jgi:benzil reductase ((S)-benzoin forming)
MQKIAVITGGGTGLGQAIAKQLAEQHLKVFIIGRRETKLNATRQFSPNNIIPIMADVSSPKGRLKILKTVENIKIDYLIHNAAVVFPIGPLESLVLKEFRKIIKTNLEAPIFLTQSLLAQLNKEARILHISSDCARYPLAYWVPYCSSKAALFMAYECLKKEFKERNISIGSIDPGMMDTPMQRAILNEKIKFPEKMTLEELQSQKLIFSAKFSATKCVKLLLEASSEEFEEGEHQ